LFFIVSDVTDKKWHYEGGVPCSKKVIGEVCLKTWRLAVKAKERFSIAQIALTVTEVSFRRLLEFFFFLTSHSK